MDESYKTAKIKLFVYLLIYFTMGFELVILPGLLKAEIYLPPCLATLSLQKWIV